MATVNDILIHLNTMAPASMKMDWDNVGLLCGRRDQVVTKMLIALDPFEGVCREAADWGAELILTHHPLIFQALKNITSDTSIGRSIRILCANDISAVNAHTNLDCAPGGVNDILAARLGLENIHVVTPEGTDDQGRPWGLLRGGEIRQQSLEEFLPQVQKALGCRGLRFVDGGRKVQKVAVGGGACAGGIVEAFQAGFDTFVTSDIKYNQFWDAKDLGMNLIDAGHFSTENPVTEYLLREFSDKFPEIEIKISETHRDCMNFFL